MGFVNAGCLDFQFTCSTGSCITKEWLCDGVKDCPLGEDENAPQCSKCESYSDISICV